MFKTAERSRSSSCPTKVRVIKFRGNQLRAKWNIWTNGQRKKSLNFHLVRLIDVIFLTKLLDFFFIQLNQLNWYIYSMETSAFIINDFSILLSRVVQTRFSCWMRNNFKLHIQNICRHWIPKKNATNLWVCRASSANRVQYQKVFFSYVVTSQIYILCKDTSKRRYIANILCTWLQWRAKTGQKCTEFDGGAIYARCIAQNKFDDGLMYCSRSGQNDK